MTDRDAQHEAAALVRSVAEGDRRALGDLIALHGRGLTLVATRYLGRADEAEEVVQDVFLRVWRHAGRYEPDRAQVSTWLYRIVVNLCIDRQRRQAFRRFVGLESAALEMVDPMPTAADTLESRQRLAKVRKAIDSLPDRQRMALLLSAVAGLDSAEVAGAMGSSRGAVEQLLVRARRALRPIADDDEEVSP